MQHGDVHLQKAHPQLDQLADILTRPLQAQDLCPDSMRPQHQVFPEAQPVLRKACQSQRQGRQTLRSLYQIQQANL